MLSAGTGSGVPIEGVRRRTSRKATHDDVRRQRHRLHNAPEVNSHDLTPEEANSCPDAALHPSLPTVAHITTSDGLFPHRTMRIFFVVRACDPIDASAF